MGQFLILELGNSFEALQHTHPLLELTYHRRVKACFLYYLLANFNQDISYYKMFYQ
jgi:hypothetical protein